MVNFDDITARVCAHTLPVIPLHISAQAITSLATQDISLSAALENGSQEIKFYSAYQVRTFEGLLHWVDLDLKFQHDLNRRYQALLASNVGSFFAGHDGVYGRGSLLPYTPWHNTLVDTLKKVSVPDACLYINSRGYYRLQEQDTVLKGLGPSQVASYVLDRTPISKVIIMCGLFERGRPFVSRRFVWAEKEEPEALAVIGPEALRYALQAEVQPKLCPDFSKRGWTLLATPPKIILQVRKGKQDHVTRLVLPVK